MTLLTCNNNNNFQRKMYFIWRYGRDRFACTHYSNEPIVIVRTLIVNSQCWTINLVVKAFIKFLPLNSLWLIPSVKTCWGFSWSSRWWSWRCGRRRTCAARGGSWGRQSSSRPADRRWCRTPRPDGRPRCESRALRNRVEERLKRLSWLNFILKYKQIFIFT